MGSRSAMRASTALVAWDLASPFGGAAVRSSSLSAARSNSVSGASKLATPLVVSLVIFPPCSRVTASVPARLKVLARHARGPKRVGRGCVARA